jgi:hypothetical protein
MFLFEYFVLIQVYKRSKNLEVISLIVAPLMIVVALYLSLWINKGKFNPFILFLVLVLLELPLSLYGYKITPDASVIERIIVAGSFGVVSVIIAKCIEQYF